MVAGKKRTGPPRSEIGVANHDLDTAIQTTRRFLETGLEHPTVAEASQAMTTAGEGHANTAKNKIYTATKFRLLDLRPNRETRLQEIFLLPLGMEILDPEHARSAKVRAFLNIELNRALYARYQGRSLPLDAELDRLLVDDLGVVEKQRQHVRRTFMRSAEQAGLFEQGRDRLALPSGVPLPPDISLPEVPDLPDTSVFNVEDGMVQPEGLGLSATVERTDGVLPVLPTPLPAMRHDRPTATIVPLPPIADSARQPILPPSVIEFWLEGRPRIDAPKAKWISWLAVLNDLLNLKSDANDASRA